MFVGLCLCVYGFDFFGFKKSVPMCVFFFFDKVHVFL